uniref:Uncharacterized protein n=1 Tax=Brassica campestris TaxID=3711 RepID=A0A3P6BC64_BRACM|nr:unnamed protein product [Brassica rapa]VDD15539.1 unnamed protein product [Brassica rapa]
MNSSRKFQNDLTANKPNGKDDVSSEVSGDPKSKKPNGKSVDSSAELLFFYFQKNDHTVGSSMESWKMQSKRVSW